MDFGVRDSFLILTKTARARGTFAVLCIADSERTLHSPTPLPPSSPHFWGGLEEHALPGCYSGFLCSPNTSLFGPLTTHCPSVAPRGQMGLEFVLPRTNEVGGVGGFIGHPRDCTPILSEPVMTVPAAQPALARAEPLDTSLSSVAGLVP